MDRELEFVIPHSPMFDNQPLPKLYCNCGFQYDNGMKRMIASPSVSGGLEHSLFDCIPLPLLITTGYIGGYWAYGIQMRYRCYAMPFLMIFAVLGVTRLLARGRKKGNA